MLYREPKLLKVAEATAQTASVPRVSVLYREPKLLKVASNVRDLGRAAGFSALP